MMSLQSLFSTLNGPTLCSRLSLTCARLTSTSIVHRKKSSLEEKLGLKPRPKPPMSPFFRYSIEVVRPRVMKENPNLKTTQISKIAGSEWKTLDEKVKTAMTEEYKLERVKYNEAVKAYEKSLSPSQREELVKAKKSIVTDKEKKDMKKERENSGYPKKPASSFVKFLSENQKNKGSSESHKDFVSRMGKVWEALPSAEKDKFAQVYQEQLKQYKLKIIEWERTMKEQGRGNLLKKSSKDEESGDGADEVKSVNKSTGIKIAYSLLLLAMIPFAVIIYYDFKF